MLIKSSISEESHLVYRTQIKLDYSNVYSKITRNTCVVKLYTVSLIIMYVTRPFFAWELEDKAGNLSQFFRFECTLFLARFHLGAQRATLPNCCELILKIKCVYFITTSCVNKPGVGGLWSNNAIFCLSGEDLSDTIFSSSSSSPNPLSIVLVDLAELSRSDLAESEFEVRLLWLPCKLSPCDCFTWILFPFVVSCAVIVSSCVLSSGDDFRFSFTSVGIGTTTFDAFEAEQPMFERELQYNKAYHVKNKRALEKLLIVNTVDTRIRKSLKRSKISPQLNLLPE